MVTAYNTRGVSQGNIVPDFRSKVILNVSGNALIPLVVTHVAASGKGPFGVDLDSDDCLVAKAISLNLGNVIKDSQGTMSSSRTRGGLNIIDNVRPSKFKDMITIISVDASVDGCVGPSKVRLDQRSRSSLPSWHKNQRLEFFGWHS